MSQDLSLPEAESGLSRRGLIRNAAGVGAAGLAAGVVLNAATGIAAAADQESAHSAAEHPAAVPDADDTLIVHVRDARTGAIDVFHGHRHRALTDPALAAALLRAAR